MFFIESGTSRLPRDRVPPESFLAAIIRYGLLCTMVAVVFVYRAASESAARAQDPAGPHAFVQRMQEARPKMLLAQIEPHFLQHPGERPWTYGLSLPGEDADDLMRYFEVALPQMR
jgi:hypothetical protein